MKYASAIAPTTGRRIYKTWKALDHAWRRPQLRAHLTRLQHAKVSLLFAQSNILLSQNTIHTTLLTQHKQALRVAFRQQCSRISRAVAGALHRTTHQARGSLDTHILSSTEPLLSLTGTMSRPSAVTLVPTKALSQRRTVIMPAWEGETQSMHHKPRVPRYVAQFRSGSDHPWMNVSESSVAASISQQLDIRSLRRRVRQVEGGVVINTPRCKLHREDFRNYLAWMATSSVIVFGSGTLLLQTVQIVIQFRQTF